MATQLTSLTMKCSVCGAPLRVTPDLGRFTCAQCGSELLVERGGGTISLKPVTDAISKVQAGTDKTAAELALKRLNEELSALFWHRNEVEGSYRSQVLSAEGNRFGNAVALGFIVIIIGFALAYVFSNVVFVIVGIFAGGAAGIAYSGARSSSYQKRATAITVSMNRDLRVIDNQIRDTRQKIARNRQIADS